MGGRLWAQGCLPGLSTLPSLETNLECAPETHTQAVGGPLWSIYTPSAKAEGKTVRVGQLLLFLSLRSLGLAVSARRQAGRGSCQFTRRLLRVPGILQRLSCFLEWIHAVTHFVDEKPEARAKEVMVFLKSTARQLQWVGLSAPPLQNLQDSGTGLASLP